MNINILTKFNRLLVCKSFYSQFRYLTIGATSYLNQTWRQKNGLPLNPNACGSLTDKPDYTFLDERPTPIGARRKNRMLKQKEITKKIILLTKEVDFAVERNQNNMQTQAKLRKNILENKLQVKGHVLLKK